MHVISDLGPGVAPDRPPGSRLIASIDVEWSKNYRIPDGNRSFCYSVVWLTLPADRTATVSTDHAPGFRCTSVYLDDDGERPALVDLAAADVALAGTADLLVGHQLCSDLAVLAANGRDSATATGLIETARTAWRGRRDGPARRVLDTRFDAESILSRRSRRLVDVCEELQLDVTQPELGRKSMTALHRDWLLHADTEARERITVLNLRHSLSAALVAARAAGWAEWDGPVNLNAMLAAGLAGRIGWLEHPTFRALVPDHRRSGP